MGGHVGRAGQLPPGSPLLLEGPKGAFPHGASDGHPPSHVSLQATVEVCWPQTLGLCHCWVAFHVSATQDISKTFFWGKEEGFDGVSGLEALRLNAFFIPLTDRAQWKEQGHCSHQLCKAHHCFPVSTLIFQCPCSILEIHRLAWPQRLVAIASTVHCWVDEGYRTPKKAKAGSHCLWHNSTKNLFLNTY